MANRYWVGGAGTWNTTSTTNWSAASGGAGGASVPTAADAVFFDQAGTYTVTCTGALACLDITVSAGVVTFATGTAPTFAISGSMSLLAGTVWSTAGALTFNATSTGKTITTNGVTIAGAITFNGVGGGWTLGSALSATGALTVTAGSLTTANYSVSAASLSSSNSNTRSISLGSSTITLTSAGLSLTNTTGLTFNAGTSQINLNAASSSISPGGLTFNNITFNGSGSISGSATINNLSIKNNNATGVVSLTLPNDLLYSVSVNGTLTMSGNGSTAASRTALYSNLFATTSTITCNAVSLSDADFRDVVFAGNCISGGNVTGTRFGDLGGNSTITFTTPKTVYWSSSTGADVSATSWSTSVGGTPDAFAFPLPQDTIIFPSAYPSPGATITNNNGYAFGTLNGSARTSNTLTYTFGVASYVMGDITLGSGCSITGLGITMAGRKLQTITPAGVTFGAPLTINSPGGTVQLQGAFSCSATTNASNTGALNVTRGTFDSNNYNVTLSAGSFNSSVSLARSVLMGSSTWTVAASGLYAWYITFGSNLTLTGSGQISMTSSAAKTFSGAGVQTYPALNQGGAGALTITGSNKFSDITNTYSATGATSVLFTSGSTNEFSAFNLTGAVGKVCTLKATTTSQTILKKPSSWLMGANSTNAGNNTNLTFAAGGGIDYLSVSYINGLSAFIGGGNFFAFF